jgi:hypothetical protein
MSNNLRQQRRLAGRLVLWLVALALALLLPRSAAAQEQDGALVVPADTTAPSVATVGQDVLVEGTVSGDVTSWSGDITVSGQVGGDVISYAGRVRVLSGGRVGGHVMAPGGVQREGESQIAGQVMGGPKGSQALASVRDVFEPGVPHSGIGAATVGRPLFGLLLGLFLLVFTLLGAAFWPRRTRQTMLTLRALPGRAIAVGLLTTLLLAALTPLLGALLTATLVGLPLLVLLALLVQAPYLYGIAALTQALGPAVRDVTADTGLGRETLAATAALALLVGLTAAIQPLAGMALLYLVASPGLGAAILSRGGMAIASPNV